MDSKQFHSVRLDKTRCNGCTNCLKRCPTEAIRVRNGRAHIIDERCIDCGECIRVCPYHAKVALTDPLSSISRFKYKIALPAPSVYGQFRNLSNTAQVISGLRQMGFDDVFEVARGADVVTRAIREKLRHGNCPKPLISAACPAIVRLIQSRFPDLIPNVVDIRQPMEVAAMIARMEFCRKNEVSPEDVGCFFITPCPAKVTAIRHPIGHATSAVDGAISIVEIYGLLSSHTRGAPPLEDVGISATSYGVSWAHTGGEAHAVCPENSLAVDGIENVIHVLEEVENNKLRDLVFIEASACTGGCVGGPLTFENNYVAKNAVDKLVAKMHTAHPEEAVDVSMMTKYPLYSQRAILPNSIMQLDEDIGQALVMMERMKGIEKNLPGYDCGSCGSPTCAAFAEDIVRGYAKEMDCVHKLKEQLKIMAEQMVQLVENTKK